MKLSRFTLIIYIQVYRATNYSHHGILLFYLYKDNTVARFSVAHHSHNNCSCVTQMSFISGSVRAKCVRLTAGALPLRSLRCRPHWPRIGTGCVARIARRLLPARVGARAAGRGAGRPRPPPTLTPSPHRRRRPRRPRPQSARTGIEKFTCVSGLEVAKTCGPVPV